MSESILLFGTQSYLYLRDKILQASSIFEPGEVLVKKFPDGERYQRILQEVNQHEVAIVGGTTSDEDTLELYDLACAMSKHGARSLTLIVPYFGYSTMERAVKPGEVVTAKTRTRLLSAIPQTSRGNRILLFDLHTEGLPHYFEGNTRPFHIYCKEIIAKACQEIAGNDFILACTDAGRAKWVESLANDMGVTAAFVFKKRLSGDTTSITGINADVKGKTVIIYDDMIRTGGSLINAGKAYQEAGAARIAAITTHGLFTNQALEKIKNAGFFKVIATDTHPNSEALRHDDFITIKSIAPLIAQTFEVFKF